MRKLVISFLFMFFAIYPVFAQTTYVSLAPSITEILYAIKADDNLLGVSTACDYPSVVKNKTKVGNNYFANQEKIINLKPDYIFGIQSVNTVNSKYLGKTKSIQFEFKNTDDIYKTILELGKLTNKENNAKNLVLSMQNKVNSIKKTTKPKKILYVIGTKPVITIGNKSFISDFIEKSGNINTTKDINSYYPQLSLEYLIKKEPDIIVVASFVKDTSDIKKYFKNAKIINLTKEQENLINRPGPRSYLAIEYFSKL